MSDRRAEKHNKIMDGLTEASPVKARKIGEKMHLTIALSDLIKLIVFTAMVVSGALTVKAQIDSLEAADKSIKTTIAEVDSLQRKDFTNTITIFRNDFQAAVATLATANETSTRELRTALETVQSALIADISSNGARVDIEMQSMKQLIISANQTTSSELRPMIDNIRSEHSLRFEALEKRMEMLQIKIDAQAIQVTQSLFSRLVNGRK